MIRSIEELFKTAQSMETKVVSVVEAADDDVLKAVREATDKNIIRPLLFGSKKKIEETAAAAGISLNGFTIIDVKDPKMVGIEAVKAVRNGDAHIFMKGMIGTRDFLKAVLNSEVGIPSGKLLSHVAAIGCSRYDRLIFLTDAAMNIAPTLDEKVGMIENAVVCARALGIEKPKVGMVCAVETVNFKMQATIDAAIITKMADRGQIRNCVVDGPFGLDNAVNARAAEHKGISGEVAGRADIIVTPDIEAGNAIYKTIGFFSDARIAAVIVGAAAPVVLTSRADTSETKLYSLCLGAVLAGVK